MRRARCKYPECRHTLGRQWWDRAPGYFKRDELRRILRPVNVWDFSALPNCGGACVGSRPGEQCPAHRTGKWWEGPRRSVLAELAHQSKRLAGQPPFADD
jgi:hypothetical protein